MPPCGCSVAFHSLSCFSLPCFRSLQPTLSCKKLHLLRLHYITGLRCAQNLTFHFTSIRFSLLQSTGCIVRLAFSSPPSAWLSCLLRRKSKSHAIHWLKTVAIHCPHTSGVLSATGGSSRSGSTAQRPQTASLHCAICIRFTRRLLKAV